MSRALILPGDLPLIAANSIRMVASQLNEHVAVVPHWQGQKGHPVGFRHECLSQLRQLCGDAGAASVLAERRKTGEVLDMQLQDEGIVRDIDTVGDLTRAEINLSLRDT
ncbi:nucleotidyltransferase family protein [Herbaspirillum camelliae]|uniref:nucleotidyltransferase family protein n=1 Tax=Herbaspirillum camelliae TaxID=1892903 RepID=UPI000949CE6D